MILVISFYSVFSISMANAESDQLKENHSESDTIVPVYREEQDTIDEVELEEYVTGVVAAEMPVLFETEALKAQSLIARTYIIHQLESGDHEDVPGGAIVTDTTGDQVYQSIEEWEEEWGEEAEEKLNIIRSAVKDTEGNIISYEGAPINATYFSTSNGYTENAEDYWEQEVPYLQSVESPWDEGAPRYENTSSYSVEEIEQQLDVTIPEEGELTTDKERTEGERVASVTIGGASFHGREVRESLGLDSSDFEWEQDGDEIIIHTKGWGHGVGMSQYGANGMAQEGNDYREIIDHYYQGIDITPMEEHVE
ncbi:stage II sporulation protein D [Salicibibacter halophilus]|nr:stage II sporulation protein D [Salicibibacter halophilus]